jgi:hypothetical protein
MTAVDSFVDIMWSTGGNLPPIVDTSTESHACEPRAGDTGGICCDDKSVRCAGVIHRFPQSTAPTITNNLYMPYMGKRTVL